MTTATNANAGTAPFTPVLLAGLALRPLPLAPLQPALALALKTVLARHPEVFERLGGLARPPIYVIDPVDLPFAFVLSPSGDTPSLTAVREGADVEATATIRGSLTALVQLLEGRADGDAAFFNRHLTIVGDTSAVVALRNAVDGAEVNLMGEIVEALGPLAKPAKRFLSFGERLLARGTADLETLRRAATAPLQRRLDSQAREIDRLKAKLAEADTPASRRRHRAGAGS